MFVVAGVFNAAQALRVVVVDIPKGKNGGIGMDMTYATLIFYEAHLNCSHYQFISLTRGKSTCPNNMS